MAESEFQQGNNDDGKTRENFKKSTEELLEKMENLTVWATQIVYDCTAIRTNPALTTTMQHLEDAFLRCKEHMEKKRQEKPN
uniref:Synaptonemal complex central element protein 3 n=1 Tax=Corvus moneduloides TaxID=1196302 RepID=A0A8C3ETF5_CORMO